LLQRNPDEFLQGEVSQALDVEALIQARLAAKKNKNFAEADAIRKQLSDAGIILEDTPQGTTWRRA
jgi:cysteinyl-tRNA synthetase